MKRRGLNLRAATGQGAARGAFLLFAQQAGADPPAGCRTASAWCVSLRSTPRAAHLLSAVLLVVLFSVPAVFAGTNVLIATSASGEEQFKQEFWSWASRIYSALRQSPEPPAKVVLLLEDPSKAQSMIGQNPGLTVAKATKAEFQKASEVLRTATGAGDTLIVILLGHGSFDGTDYKFNLIGPDMTGTELGKMLDGSQSERVVLVAATPSSGILSRTLAHKNRVVITATKSEMENNDTLFGGFFAEGLESDEADTDKNGQVSVLEAYMYAQKKVEASYKERQKLATEHSMLEDDGNGRGSSIPGPATGDGLLAARIALTGVGPRQLASAKGEAASPAVPASGPLADEKKRIEGAIEELKYRKASMPEAEYQKSLEKLLLDLARVDARIRKEKER